MAAMCSGGGRMVGQWQGRQPVCEDGCRLHVVMEGAIGGREETVHQEMNEFFLVFFHGGSGWGNCREELQWPSFFM